MADSEHTPEQISQARLVVAGAIAAAGKMDSSVSWKGRVNALIPEVASMLGDGSNQMYHALQMVNATVFTAPYLSHEIEESSTRILLHLEHRIEPDHPEGQQVVRCERTDGEAGKRQLDKLKDVQPGDTLLCFKVFEKIKSGKNVGREAAAIKHFEKLPPRKDAGTGVPPARPSRHELSAPEGVSLPPPSGAISPDEMGRFNDATQDLDNKTKVAVVRDLVAAKLWPPDPTNVDRVLTFVKEWSF